MLYEKLLTEDNEEKTEESRAKRIKELQEFIKAQSHLHDDHGSAIIGSRDHPPHFSD